MVLATSLSLSLSMRNAATHGNGITPGTTDTSRLISQQSVVVLQLLVGIIKDTEGMGDFPPLSVLSSNVGFGYDVVFCVTDLL